MRSTALIRLPDRLVLLISGDSEGGSMVYRTVELPLSSNSQAVGATVREGLNGDREITEAEEQLAIELGKTPLFGDFAEWTEKYSGVTVLESQDHLKLRARAAGSLKGTESFVLADVNNKSLGQAILDAFERM